MKRIAALVLALAPMVATAQTTKWEHTLDAAKARARAEKKQIFLDLWAEWCGPCQHLKKKVFPTAEANAALSHFVAAEIMVETMDRTPNPEGTKLAEAFNLSAFPSLYILDAEGKIVRTHVGAFKDGASFAAWLQGKN
jgi:thiol:disulfide interchange protein